MAIQTQAAASSSLLAAQVAAAARERAGDKQAAESTPTAAAAAPAKPRAQVTPIRRAESTPAASPAPDILPPAALSSSSATLDLPALAAQFDTFVRQAKNSLCGIAYTAYRLDLANDWASINHTSAEDFCQARGVSPGMWRSYTRLGKHLQHLTFDEMAELTLAAARALAAIHPSLWDEYPWLQEAKLLTAREFEVLVRQRNNQLLGTSFAEPKTKMALAIPVSQQQAVTKQLDTLRRREKLSTPGEALLAALTAEEQLSAIRTKLAPAILELDSLWATARETASERDARLDGVAATHAPGGSLTAAGARSQELARKLIKLLRETGVLAD